MRYRLFPLSFYYIYAVILSSIGLAYGLTYAHLSIFRFGTGLFIVLNIQILVLWMIAYYRLEGNVLEFTCLWHRWSIPYSQITYIESTEPWFNLNQKSVKLYYASHTKTLLVARRKEFIDDLATHAPQAKIVQSVQ